MTIVRELSLEWILTAIGFVAAYIVGLWQYRRTQRQDKIGLLLPLITEFETDEELRAARHLFDYDGGTFTVNEQKYTFKNADLLEAMRVVKDDLGWAPLHVAMRKVLDRYFDFFGKLASLVEVRLFTFTDLKYFYYYFELLAKIEEYKNSDFVPALNKYLNAYRFVNCRTCLEMYRNLPPSQRMALRLPGSRRKGSK